MPEDEVISQPPASNGSSRKKPKKKAAANGVVVAESSSSASTPQLARAATAPASSTEKENKSRKSTGSAASASPGSSKSWVELVHEAIVALKERNGSSQIAINKYLQNTYPDRATGPYYKHRLNQAIKTGVRNERFAKVRASYKISTKWKDKQRQAKKKAAAAAAAAKKKKQKNKKPESLQETQQRHAKKRAQLEKNTTLSAEELVKEKQKLERLEAAAAKKALELKKQKERSDTLRKRRFPMEDTKLHEQDKQWNVKPPPDVVKRPHLPYFWHLTRPLSDASRQGKTSSTVLQASKVDALDCGSPGLVPDLLSVYHFFCGDVHFNNSNNDDNKMFPEFTLQQLVFAVDQVLSGYAKTCRMLPPLLVHLFCTCLGIVCGPPEQLLDVESSSSVTVDQSSAPTIASERKLRRDLHQYLFRSLTPASWPDVCFLYMDAMERYYSTDASRDPNVVSSLNIDMEYLLHIKDQPEVPMTPFVTQQKQQQQAGTEETAPQQQHTLPDGYHAYLGDSRGVLYRAHYKLARQDPWLLTAEELVALLRALTDDILATHPAVNHDLAAREEEMQVLLKAKRAADANFRKVRLAYEGPKTKPAKKASSSSSSTAADENKDQKVEKGEDNDENEKEEEEQPFKPTATKKQFESAKRAQQKANDTYEKGIHKLVARTEPVGYDRNFNAVYCFRHDPEVLYVEDLRSPSSVAFRLPSDMQFPRRSWHVIETTSLFDVFTLSLDIRGRREHDLYEGLLGPQGTQQSLRRFLYDDVKEQADASAKLREKEALKKRLQVARVKCDEEKGRRSGRLAGQAEVELLQVEEEMRELERRIEGQIEPDTRDYAELTGLELLRKFDSNGRMETRRTTREQKAASSRSHLPLFHCSKLVSTGNIDGTGVIGMLVSELLELEEHCHALAPWEKEGMDRSTWISQLEGAVCAWNNMSPIVIGSPESVRNGVSPPPPPAAASAAVASTPNTTRQLKRDSFDTINSMGSASKRRRFESPMSTNSTSSSHAVSTILNMLKQPLLDLEERVADITNVVVATRDADLADDNMSMDGSGDDEAEKERLERAWKKIVHRIRSTPSRRHVQIREMVVSAIAAARKAHLPQVVAQLRSALLQYHPNAAGDCKAAAVQVLESHGDYEEDEDDDLDDDDEEEVNDNEEEEMPSVVAADAAVLVSSLGGSDDATRADWIDAVKSCKTISRLAALTSGFVRDAMDRLKKVEIEHEDLVDAIAKWEKEEERRARNRAGKKTTTPTTKGFAGPSEVWANVRFTDEICMAKAEEYPWWPAKKCVAKDPDTANSLNNLNRSLVSLIGEQGGLRVVQNENIMAFTGTTIEEKEDTEISKEMRNQLVDCMAMARRILRGREKQQQQQLEG